MAMSLSTAGPLSNTIPTAHPSPQAKRHLSRFSRFAQMTPECPYTLQWDAPSPLKIAPSHWLSGPTSNTWFFGPTRILNPNGISIGAAVFAELTSMTDRPTDRPRYTVGNNKPHLRTIHSTMMQPNNNNNNCHLRIKTILSGNFGHFYVACCSCVHMLSRCFEHCA